jgi:hypothetical protein
MKAETRNQKAEISRQKRGATGSAETSPEAHVTTHLFISDF